MSRKFCNHRSVFGTQNNDKRYISTVIDNKQFYLLADQNINNIAHARIQRGREGPDPPLENHKNIGFLSKTGPDSLKNHIAYSSILILSSAKNKQKKAQWLSGRVLDSRPRGRGFESHRRHCVVSLSKNINPSLVLVQPRKTRPYITEKLLMGRKRPTGKKRSCQTWTHSYPRMLLSHFTIYVFFHINSALNLAMVNIIMPYTFPYFFLSCLRCKQIFSFKLENNVDLDQITSSEAS